MNIKKELILFTVIVLIVISNYILVYLRVLDKFTLSLTLIVSILFVSILSIILMLRIRKKIKEIIL
ncbi:hypothetical protein ACPB8Q_00045 [Methanocaldococcus indicus]|uniref:hypothetical protein n=1 Tax=Methanocaldococcus indicus TaxID=213231 RepID=UPI003C6D737D